MADASALKQRIQDGANNVMRATTEQVVTELIDAWNGVVRRHTGEPHLEDTKFSEQLSDGDRISWRVGFTAPQGEWLEEGVDAHTIGELGTLMHWFDESGAEFFRRYTGWTVDLPARPWFNVRLNEIWPDIVAANLDAAGW